MPTGCTRGKTDGARATRITMCNRRIRWMNGHSPPFEPTERNNNIYARGAVDDKGQLWMEVKALESLMKPHGGKLPINVKVIFEGEEEVGGESIADYVRKQKAKLKADFALVCDTELFAPDLPTLCVGLRGLVYTEIEAYRSEDRFALRDVWWRGSEPFLRADRDHQQAEGFQGQGADSRVLLEGEGADHRRIESLEAPAVQRRALSQDRSRIEGAHWRAGLLRALSHVGASDAGSSWNAGRFCRRARRLSFPAKAKAKVSMRLVPNQDPEDILKSFWRFVKKLTPKGIDTKIKVWSKGPACVCQHRQRIHPKRPPRLCTTLSRKTQCSFVREDRFRSSPTFRMC